MIATNIATNVFAFVLVLGILIFAHEAGHFFVAKLFRVRVLVFSFGFGQRLFGFKKGDTDYRVSLIPLGGYVRMAGDMPEDETQPHDPGDFLAKPRWQRFLILLAGPLMNLLIAIAFVAAINMAGTETLIMKPVIGEVTAGKPAARAGLQPGDRITAINGDRIDGFDDLRMAISMHAGTPLRVDFIRNGTTHTTTMTPDRENSDFGPVGKAGVRPWIDAVVGRTRPNSPAEKAGLRPGDRILSANGRPVNELAQFDAVLEQAKGAPVTLAIARGGQRMQLVLPPSKDPQDAYRGFIPPTEIRKLPLGAAVADSLQQNWKTLKYTGVSIKRIFQGEGSVKELSGPISIARISGEMLRQGWIAVIALMAMISLQLGIMNLLPIPVLDGGHIMVLLVEGAVRRDLSIRVKERIQQVGFAVLAALMIVVLYNDVITNVLLMKKG